MVLPAFYRLWQEGSAAGEVEAHRQRPRRRRPPRLPRYVRGVADRVRRRTAGQDLEGLRRARLLRRRRFRDRRPRAACSTSRPGARPPRRRTPSSCTTWRSRRPLRRRHRGARRARPGRRRAGRLREAVRDVAGRSSRELDKTVHSVLDEDQVYRIDHFLGKEATQNLHVLRFANGLFDAMWSRKHVRAVQIDVPERLGITDRAAVLRRHRRRARHARHAPVPGRGRGGDGTAREPVAAAPAGRARGGHRRVPPARPGRGRARPVRRATATSRASAKTRRTDTYVAARLWIDNDRWRGVPFLLRTGKRLAQSHQRVSLILREPTRHARGRAEGGQRAQLRAVRQRRDRPAAWWPSSPVPELELETRPTRDPAGDARPAPTRCRPTSG